MNASLMKQLFLRLNGRVLSSQSRQGSEVWVLRKPAVPTSGRLSSGESLTIGRHLMKAFRVAATIMLRARRRDAQAREALQASPFQTRTFHPHIAIKTANRRG